MKEPARRAVRLVTPARHENDSNGGPRRGMFDSKLAMATRLRVAHPNSAK